MTDTENLLKLADSLEQGILIEKHSDGSETRELSETQRKAVEAIRALIAQRDAYWEALEDIKNHGVSQSEAMNMPEDRWAWRCFNRLQRIAHEALTRANELAGDKHA